MCDARSDTIFQELVLRTMKEDMTTVVEVETIGKEKEEGASLQGMGVKLPLKRSCIESLLQHTQTISYNERRVIEMFRQW